MTMNAAPCPVCGHVPELPTITPEMLYFRSTGTSLAAPKLGAAMPDGSYAVCFAGIIYAMRPHEWSQYEAMRAASVRLDDDFHREAA
jgi:hypothetical protein